MEFDSFTTHSIDMYMGKPKSGKTLIAGSYPKPLLYVSIGNDGGGRVLQMAYRDDVAKGLIKVKNIQNDPIVNGKIQKTSIDKVAELLRDLRKEGNPFKTIVFDTVGALQDDYKSYMEFSKGGKSLTMQEWGDIGKMMFGLKDNMKRFSQESDTQIVWIFHTREQEIYETSGLDKEIRIIPDLTISTGVKFMKDASNIFYCCRKTVISDNGERDVKFLTYVGPHPLMDTGTRDLYLKHGEFVEDFSYAKLQKMIETQQVESVNLAVTNINEKEEEIENND